MWDLTVGRAWECKEDDQADVSTHTDMLRAELRTAEQDPPNSTAT